MTVQKPEDWASLLVDGGNPNDVTTPIFAIRPLPAQEGVCEGGQEHVLTLTRAAYKRLIAEAFRAALVAETIRCAEKARRIYTGTDSTPDRVAGAILNGIVGRRICTPESGIQSPEDVVQAVQGLHARVSQPPIVVTPRLPMTDMAGAVWADRDGTRFVVRSVREGEGVVTLCRQGGAGEEVFTEHSLGEFCPTPEFPQGFHGYRFVPAGPQ